MSSIPQTNLQAQKIQAIAITVIDLERSIEFYTKVLGFKIISNTKFQDNTLNNLESKSQTNIQVATLQLGDETIRLQKYLDISGKPIPQNSQSNDLWFQHLAIVVSDLDRAYEHLQTFPLEAISTNPQTIPPENKEAAGIRAFKFRDPDRHPLELIWFPLEKGQEKWHQKSDQLFLGIDHTAIAVDNTEQSLQFYRDFLGMQVVGGSLNWGETQADLDGLPQAKVRITALRPRQGGLGIELLDYLEPGNGRPIPSDLNPYDIAYAQVELIAKAGDRPTQPTYQLKDPTGHPVSIAIQHNN